MDAGTFWERVNTLIKERRTTQRTLSLECGFTARRIESLVSNRRLPDGIETYLIAQGLSVTVEYLITGKSPDSNRAYIERLEAIKTLINQPLLPNSPHTPL